MLKLFEVLKFGLVLGVVLGVVACAPSYPYVTKYGEGNARATYYDRCDVLAEFDARLEFFLSFTDWVQAGEVRVGPRNLDDRMSVYEVELLKFWDAGL